MMIAIKVSDLLNLTPSDVTLANATLRYYDTIYEDVAYALYTPRHLEWSDELLELVNNLGHAGLGYGLIAGENNVTIPSTSTTSGD